MAMPGRKFSAGSGYRYGFNGKENDKDAGEGIQDYGMRIYSERLGKFLSVDPITSRYPELTPYQFASNTPLQAIDLDGLERYDYTLTFSAQGDSKLTLSKVTDVTTEYPTQYWDKNGKIHAGSPIVAKNQYKEYNVRYDYVEHQPTEVFVVPHPNNITITYSSDPTKMNMQTITDDIDKALEKRYSSATNQFITGLAQGASLSHAMSSRPRRFKIPELDVKNRALSAHTSAPAAQQGGTATQSSTPLPGSNYNRVKPRVSTLKQVEQNQPRNALGQMIDPNTKKPLTPGQIDLGHVPGQEWRTRQKNHIRNGSTRKEVIEAENNPYIYQFEDRSSNRSHKFEIKSHQ